MAHLLERSAVAGAIATGVRGVEGIDGLLAQHFGQVFQGGGLTAAEENLAVHVAHDGIRIILVDGFQLASRLQNKAGGDLTAADGGHQLFQIGNLPDVGALVDQAPHMDGQLAAVHIICLVAQQIEKLGVDHADEEVEGAVRIAHDEEQRRFLIAQRVQFQLIVHGEVIDGAQGAFLLGILKKASGFFPKPDTLQFHLLFLLWGLLQFLPGFLM